MIALVEPDKSIRLLDVDTAHSRLLPGQVRTRGPEDFGKQIAFSPDGVYFGFVLDDGSARVLVLATNRQINIPRANGAAVISFAFSEDGMTLALGHENGCLALWDLEREEYRKIILGAHGLGISALAFSPDNRTLATGSADATAKLWDPETGEPNGSLPGIAGQVGALSFSGDGRTLAVGVRDRVTLWHIASRSAMVELRLREQSAIRWLSFPKDDNTLISYSEDKNSRVIDFWSADGPGGR